MALATLIRSRGSSYRRPGARMLIRTDGSTVGSLSGGCLEEEVAQCALQVLRTGKPSLMHFDTRRRFGCNGSIEIFVERARDDFFAAIATSWRARRGFRAVTVVAEDEQQSGSRVLGLEEITPQGAFVQDIEPPVRLIIFGDGPDSHPLRMMSELLGWSVIEVEHAAELPTQVDARTAAVIKSHNYGRDCAALRQLLELNLRYVGLLGPRRRRDEILGDLLDSGVSISAELFAPAGRDFGAETPEEIALSIVAEIQALFAEASGESLRDRNAPIHGWNLVRPDPITVEQCETSRP